MVAGAQLVVLAGIMTPNSPLRAVLDSMPDNISIKTWKGAIADRVNGFAGR